MSKTPLWKFGNRRWGCQGVSKGWVEVPAEPCRALGGLRGLAPLHPTKPPRNAPGACAPGRGWRRDFSLRPGSTREVFLPPLCECERVSGCGMDAQKASSPKASARPQRGARLEPGVPALGGLHGRAERQLGEKKHLHGALSYEILWGVRGRCLRSHTFEALGVVFCLDKRPCLGPAVQEGRSTAGLAAGPGYLTPFGKLGLETSRKQPAEPPRRLPHPKRGAVLFGHLFLSKNCLGFGLAWERRASGGARLLPGEGKGGKNPKSPRFMNTTCTVNIRHRGGRMRSNLEMSPPAFGAFLRGRKQGPIMLPLCWKPAPQVPWVLLAASCQQWGFCGSFKLPKTSGTGPSSVGLPWAWLTSEPPLEGELQPEIRRWGGGALGWLRASVSLLLASFTPPSSPPQTPQHRTRTR